MLKPVGIKNWLLKYLLTQTQGKRPEVVSPRSSTSLCEAQLVKVIKHISKLDHGVIRQVRDFELSVNALFTTDAINRAFLSEDSQMDWLYSVVILKKYHVEILPPESQGENPELQLVVADCTLLNLQRGFDFKDCPRYWTHYGELLQQVHRSIFSQVEDDNDVDIEGGSEENSIPLTQLLMEMNADSSESSPSSQLQPPQQFQCCCITDKHQPASICIQHFTINAADEKRLSDMPEWSPETCSLPSCTLSALQPQTLNSNTYIAARTALPLVHEAAIGTEDAQGRCQSKHVQNRSAQADSIDIGRLTGHADVGVEVGESLLMSSQTCVSEVARRSRGQRASSVTDSVCTATTASLCAVEPSGPSELLPKKPSELQKIVEETEWHEAAEPSPDCDNDGDRVTESPVIVIVPDNTVSPRYHHPSCDEHSSYEKCDSISGPLDNLAQLQPSGGVELAVDAEHGYARTSLLSQDVLEDLFEANMMKENAEHWKRNYECICQSTQVSCAETPGDAVIIRPEFPLSPLQCTTVGVIITADSNIVTTSPSVRSAGRVCNDMEMVTVTAPQSRPNTTPVDCAADHRPVSSESSSVSLPSAVIDRVRNLFCVFDSGNTRASTSTGSSSDRPVGLDSQLVTEADGIFVSCSGESSPLYSSYVDGGQMNCLQSDTGIMSKGTSVDAVDVPFVATCANSGTGEICISDVRSLGIPVDLFPAARQLSDSPAITDPCCSPSRSLGSTGSPSRSSTNSALLNHSNYAVEKERRSPDSNSGRSGPPSGLKRKRSLSRKEHARKSDALFRRVKKVKHPNNKHRLYKQNMLMEDGVETYSDDSNTNIDVDSSSDGVNTAARREQTLVQVLRSNSATITARREIPSPLPVCAAVSACPAPNATNDQPHNSCTAVSLNSTASLCQNPVDAGVRVEINARRLALNTQSDLNALLPRYLSLLSTAAAENIDLRASGEQQMEDAQRERAVTAQTYHGVQDSEAVVTASVSAHVPSDTIPGDNGVRDVSVVMRSAGGNHTVRQSLTDDCRPGSWPADQLVASVGVELAETCQLQVADVSLHSSETTSHDTESATTSSTADKASDGENLPVAKSDCQNSPNMRRDDSSLVCSSTQYHHRDAAAAGGKKPVNTPVVVDATDCEPSVSDARDNTSTDPVPVLTDRNTDEQCVLRKRLAENSRRTTDVNCGKTVNETDAVQDCGASRYLRSKKRPLSVRKFSKQTPVTSRAHTRVTDQNKNIVTSSHKVVHRTLESHSTENIKSSVDMSNLSDATKENSSDNLPCGQRQSDETNSIPNITVSLCRLSPARRPFPPSQQRTEDIRGTMDLRETSTNADGFALDPDGDKNQLQSVAYSCSGVSGLKSGASSSESSSGVLCTGCDVSDVLSRTAAAAVSSPETEPKQASSDPSTVNGKLTLPTPKNSLTSYQPANCLPPTTLVTDSFTSSSASQNQPNYTAIQEILGLTRLSDSRLKVYTYQLPADVELRAFRYYRLYQRPPTHC